MAGIKRTPREHRNQTSTGVSRVVLQPGLQTARDRRARRHSSLGRNRKGRSLSSASNPPPVLVRRGLQDMATPLRGGAKRRAKDPRRRYDLTLNVPGAEVRLPSLPMVHFSWRVASGLLFALMALSLYMVLFSPAFQADVLEVEGMHRLTMNDLSLVLDITGEPIVTLDPGQIRSNLLQAFPDLKQVKVYINLPASVRLEVEERQPVISWQRSGETVWIDQEGVVFPPRGEVSEPLLNLWAETLPYLNNVNFAESESSSTPQVERLDPKLIQVLLEMRQYAPAGTTMVYDSEHGFSWEDERGWQVYFGRRLNDVGQKLFVYQAIVDRLQAEGIQPALISMEYLHAPYFRLER